MKAEEVQVDNLQKFIVITASSKGIRKTEKAKLLQRKPQHIIKQPTKNIRDFTSDFFKVHCCQIY